MKKLSLLLLFILIMAGCRKNMHESIINGVAEQYVKLVLEVGLYDGDVVDAYYGPEEWKRELPPPADIIPAAELVKKADALIGKLNSLTLPSDDGMLRFRVNYLQKQLRAVRAKILMISGKKMKFDEESALLYDATAPSFTAEHFAGLIKKLDAELPGKGDIRKRFLNFRNRFVIPPEKLEEVFKAAITEARKRTLSHIEMPEGENFKVELVKDKPWGAYNWYKGHYFSVIQVNTDLPVFIDRAVDLACHEGYPGHHVYNSLLEEKLYRGKGWVEFSIYDLFSPQSLIAEGTANFGIEVAFPGEERIKFEKEVLFPLAGLDPQSAEKYYEILRLVHELSYASNEANRGYLDGNMSAAERKEWLMKYALYSEERAEQSLSFVEKYRSYVINYNYGQDLVKNYVENRGGTADNKELRWKIFTGIISRPITPSYLTTNAGK